MEGAAAGAIAAAPVGVGAEAGAVSGAGAVAIGAVVAGAVLLWWCVDAFVGHLVVRLALVTSLDLVGRTGCIP